MILEAANYARRYQIAVIITATFDHTIFTTVKAAQKPYLWDTLSILFYRDETCVEIAQPGAAGV
jgi:hypothetical protein